MSSDVGQDFWHGASAHLRQRADSRSAALSESVVCLISRKSFSYGLLPSVQLFVLHPFGEFLFQFNLFFLVSIVGMAFACVFTRGLSARIA